MLKSILRNLTPPIIWKAAHSLKGYAARTLEPVEQKYGFFGDYKSYDEALADCITGYSSPGVMQTTLKNTFAAKAKVYEKQVLSPTTATFTAAVLAAILQTGKKHLRIADFGGAMGSHYFRLRALLPADITLEYHVLDLPETLEAAAPLADNELRFTKNLSELPELDIMIASCVFQVLPDPWGTLSSILDLKAPHTILPLIPLQDNTEDRLTVQRVNPAIFDAQYPHYFFSRTKLEKFFSSRVDYKIVSEWREPEYTNPLDGVPCNYWGFHLRLT